MAVSGASVRHAELKALQSQINPHFLYNTLDMINWMAQKDETDNIRNVVQAMSKFYRLTLSKGRDIVTVGDEIKMCEAYMEIQRRRYRGKIVYEVEVDEGFFFREDLRKEWGLEPITDSELSRETRFASEKWYEEVELPYLAWQDGISGQAVPDPMGEFSMDLSELELVVDQMEQIRLQYFQPILCGYYADTEQALQEANAALEQAGFDAYFNSVQRQIADYFTEKE